MQNAALPGALLFLALLVISAEVAQVLLLRSRYWGRGESAPFYALTFRASIAGLMALGLFSQYLSLSFTTGITWDGIALTFTQSLAVLMLEAAGALLALRPTPSSGRTSGGPIPAGIFGAIGFFLLGIGALSGEIGAFVGALLALLGGIFVYQRLRPILGQVSPPESGAPLPRTGPTPAFGRLEGSEPKK